MKTVEVWRGRGVDISSFRPEDLKRIDDRLSDAFRHDAHAVPGALQGSVMGIGSYVGEVFVRNLGARWHFPNVFQAFLQTRSSDDARADRYWYVVLNGRKAYVFRAAREAIERTSAGFSLYHFYRDWEEGSKDQILPSAK